MKLVKNRFHNMSKSDHLRFLTLQLIQVSFSEENKSLYHYYWPNAVSEVNLKELEGDLAHVVFQNWDVAIAILDLPFDIGIPYANPMCLYPPDKVGKESDWDGELFGVIGILFNSTHQYLRAKYTLIFVGYGINNDVGPKDDPGRRTLRYTGLNKIPTRSECYSYYKPNDPLPTINETEASKASML